MPNIMNVLATLHGLGPDNIIGAPYGGGINNLGSFTAAPASIVPDGGAAANVMQALSTPPAPQAAPDPTAAPVAAPAVTAPATTAQPRQKHSILDILGGIADAVATAGGAKAQYQPTLDAALARQNAAEDRTNALQDRQRQINMDDLKMALMKNQAETASTDAEKAREGNAIQYVQAVQAAGGDAGAAWAKAAGLAGVSPERTSIIGQMISADPQNEHGTLEGLDALRNGIEEYNTAPVQAYNPKTGEYEIVQVGKHGGKNITKLDDGFTIPSSSAVQVDAGGVKKVIDPRTGRVLATTNVTVSPDTAATNNNRIVTTRMQNDNHIQVEKMKGDAAAAKPAKGALTPVEQYSSYSGARAALVQMRNDIQSLATNKNVPAATGFINGAIDTPARQEVLAKIAAIEGQAAPVALGIARAGGAKNPGQKEVLAISKGLISDLHLLRQSTGSFQENAAAAVSRMNRQIAQLDDNARRSGIVNGGQPAAPVPGRRILPAPAGARPAQPVIRNW